ncbi:MAG: universal stress protein [Pedobacter sp.]|nr:MAG: universal stress protein [Pedobacter sp.]
MKQILVPVDFSDCAINASNYAIAMATVLTASLHFCHAIKIPANNPMSGLIVWPLEEYADIKNQADQNLAFFVAQFSKANSDILITQSTEVGTVKEVVNKLCEEKKIDMVVIGLAGANKIEQFVIGSNSKMLIEKTKTPILLVPKQASFDGLKKIAFATDLRESDVNAVHQLASICYAFGSDILLTHVASKDKSTENKVKHFLNCITNKINYAHIYYRHINSNNTYDGLEWITENTQISLIAMIHRDRKLFADIFETSHTKKLAQFTKLPLLVLPDKFENN